MGGVDEQARSSSYRARARATLLPLLCFRSPPRRRRWRPSPLSSPRASRPPISPPRTQPAPAGTPDIVVTAQFREQRLQDTPLSITAVPAQLLEQRGQHSLAEVTNQAPNVQLRQAGASFGDSLTAFIRGVGQADFDPALEPGVGMYIDDVYYSSLTGANFELLDLERVEVLRGPQGTLQGRNSEGGTIRLISRRPDANTDGFLEVGYGSRNLLSVRGGANFTIADGLYARISGTARQQEGYVDRIDYGCAHPGGGIAALQGAGNCVIDRLGGIGHTAVRGQLRYHPNPDFDLLLSADYTHIDQTNTAGVLTFASLNNVNTNPAPGIPFDSRFICGRFCNYAQFSQPAGTFQVSPFGQIALGLAPTYPMGASHRRRSPALRRLEPCSQSRLARRRAREPAIDHRLSRVEAEFQFGRRPFAGQHQHGRRPAELLVLQPGGAPQRGPRRAISSSPWAAITATSGRPITRCRTSATSPRTFRASAIRPSTRCSSSATTR